MGADNWFMLIISFKFVVYIQSFIQCVPFIAVCNFKFIVCGYIESFKCSFMAVCSDNENRAQED